MNSRKLSRRSLLRAATQAAVVGTGASILAACAPPAPAAPAAPSTSSTPAAGEPTVAPVTAPDATGKTVIKWWDMPRGWAPPGTPEKPNTWNEDVAKQFMDKNPDVSIEFTTLPWGDAIQKLDVAVAAGDPPDMQYGYPALFGKYVAADVLQPIDEYFNLMSQEDRDDFFEPSLDFVTVNGKKMAWPWYYSSEGEWVINTTLVAEAKAEDLLPKAPDFAWTPEQFIELAKKLTFTRGSDQIWGTYVAANEKQGIDLYPFWAYPYMFGAKLYDEATRKSDFGGEAGVKAFQLMYDVVNTHKVAPPGAAGLTRDNMSELWNRQQLGIYPTNGIDIIAGIKAGLESGTIKGPFETLPVQPPVSEGLPVRTNGATGVQMIFKTDDARREGAMKLAEFVTSKDNLKIFQYLTKLCARKSTTELLAKDDPVSQWRIKYILPTMANYSKAPEDIKIDDAWMQTVQSMYTDEKAPADAAKSFETDANKILGAA